MTPRPKLLLVDDDNAITSTLTVFLNLSGFDVSIAHDGEEALQKLYTGSFDLVILDVLMPQLDGRETLRRLRTQDNWTPILMLSKMSGTPERIMALEEGADDYLNKPFDPKELVVRIRAILRRIHQGSRSPQQVRQLESNDLILDRISRRVWLNNDEVTITPKAVALLEYLMLHQRELVSREELLNVIWGWENPFGTRAVDARIAELRKVLGENPSEPHYIETIPGHGYRFLGMVTEIS